MMKRCIVNDQQLCFGDDRFDKMIFVAKTEQRLFFGFQQHFFVAESLNFCSSMC